MDTDHLEQLQGIFPDRSSTELRGVLRRCNDNVHEAAEAILFGETVGGSSEEDSSRSASTPQRHQDPQLTASPVITPTIAALPPVACASQRETRTSPSTSVNEEVQYQQALEQSMAPENRGLDYLSDEELAEIMKDPAFLASLDHDLKTAVQMQTKLETAEAEWRSLEQQKQRQTLQRLKRAVRERLAEKQLQQLSPLVVRARSKFGVATQAEAVLVEQLEAMNRENADEQQRRAIRLEARQAMMETVQQHLNSFRSQHPTATYEAWIQALHPENAHEGLLLPELDKTIDHRFYVPDSEHLQLWNASCESAGDSALMVAARTGGDVHQGVPDLLSTDEYPASCRPHPANATFDPFGLSTSGGEDNGMPDFPSGVQRYPPPLSSASFHNNTGPEFAENVTFGPFGLHSSTS